MTWNFENMSMQEILQLNAKLNQKKNEVRKKLAEKGVLQKKGKNDHSGYKYFSESQYKQLFTELFSECGLELKVSEVDYMPYEASGKMNIGRIVKLEFCLIDTETGFFENSVISGEGLDSGDKAGYKAYTGALKYYLADTFMVATGDDPEKDTPVVEDMGTKYVSTAKRKVFKQLCEKLGENPEEILMKVGATSWNITEEEYGKAMIIIKEIENARQERV